MLVRSDAVRVECTLGAHWAGLHQRERERNYEAIPFCRVMEERFGMCCNQRQPCLIGRLLMVPPTDPYVLVPILS